jgi:hypothetical protein
MAIDNIFHCSKLTTGTEYLYKYDCTENINAGRDKKHLSNTKYSFLERDRLESQSKLTNVSNSFDIANKILKALNYILDRMEMHHLPIDVTIVSVNGSSLVGTHVEESIKRQLKGENLQFLFNKGCCEGLRVVNNIFEANVGKELSLCVINIDAFSSLYEQNITPKYLFNLFNDGISVKLLHNTLDQRNLWSYSSFCEYKIPDNQHSLYLNRSGSYNIGLQVPKLALQAFELANEGDTGFAEGERSLYLHPGGKKIIRLLKKRYPRLSLYFDRAEQHFNTYKNMGSNSLDLFLEREYLRGGTSLASGKLISFGPGFTAITFELHA